MENKEFLRKNYSRIMGWEIGELIEKIREIDPNKKNDSAEKIITNALEMYLSVLKPQEIRKNISGIKYDILEERIFI